MTDVIMVVHLRQPGSLRMAYAYLYTVKATANGLGHGIRTACIRPQFIFGVLFFKMTSSSLAKH